MSQETQSEPIIDVTEYINKDNTRQLTTYTAKWCGPCTRIKQSFPELLADFIIISESTMVKSAFKKDINDYIPCFVLVDVQNQITYSIQTSKEAELKEFINQEFDNDF